MANNAVQLNGSTQYGTASNYTALNGLGAYTIEGWFYRHDTVATYALAASISKSDGTVDFCELQRDANNALGINFTTRYSTTNADGFKNLGPWTVDTYIYTAMVFDPAGDKKTHIYFGSSATEISSYDLQRTAVGTQQNSTGMLFYMAYDPSDSGSGKWLGNIGGFLRLWNVARTTAQLSANYNLGLQSANESGLIGNWKFGEGSGTSIANEYSSGNAISLTGTPSWTTGPTITEKSYGSTAVKMQAMRGWSFPI